MGTSVLFFCCCLHLIQYCWSCSWCICWCCRWDMEKDEIQFEILWYPEWPTGENWLVEAMVVGECCTIELWKWCRKVEFWMHTAKKKFCRFCWDGRPYMWPSFNSLLPSQHVYWSFPKVWMQFCYISVLNVCWIRSDKAELKLTKWRKIPKEDETCSFVGKAKVLASVSNFWISDVLIQIARNEAANLGVA